MAYRLGLDVGTASCGLIAWTLNKDGQPSELAYHSLDIWSEPLLPAKSGGVGEPKKAARRAARMLRRQINRRARRLRRIAHLASLLGLSHTKMIPPDNGQRIHRVRAQAVEKRIELEDLLRVLLRLAKNRGPSGDWVYVEHEKQTKNIKKANKGNVAASNAPVSSTDAVKKATEERKSIVDGVRKLEAAMREVADALGKSELTLGQYLAYRFDHGDGVLIGKSGIGLYPSRKMVEAEFNCIWDKQSEFYPVLCDTNIRRKFFDAIFYQRPLKSPAPMVGRCPLEPTLPRAPMAQMASQTFRIEKQLSDLRWGLGKDAQPLSGKQLEVIRQLLNEHAEIDFRTIREALVEAGCPGPDEHGLNMERATRESLKGNTTLAALRRLGLESDWKTLDEMTQVQVINFLADLGSPDVLESEDWPQNFIKSDKTKRAFSPQLVEFIDHLRNHPKFGRLSTMGFEGGRMSYSIKALRKLTALMREGYDERAAVDQAYPDHNKPNLQSRELPLPKETGNTIVDVALRQVYRAVRRAIDQLGGPPAQVIVELSREMALGVRKRSEIETKININNKARCDAAKEIVIHGEQVTDKHIDRYLLWEQQKHYCPYCEQRIELGEALGSETEREHILPRTLTRVGGKRSQLVLAHKACNNAKGNRTPWQAFGHDDARWRIIEARAAQLRESKQFGKAKLLLLKDWEDEVLDDKAIAGFSDRQFHESSWIAKAVAQWLRSVCVDISVSRGELTAHLRRIWKLDTVIPEVRYVQDLPVLDREGKPIAKEEFEKHKLWWEGHDERAGGVPTDRKPDKRIDHRHHLVDALVISLTDRRLFRKMAENYKHERERERRGERGKLSLYEVPSVRDLRNLAVDIVTNATICHKPDRHPDGPLFKQSAYGVSRKPRDDEEYQLAIKKPLVDLIDSKGSVEKTRVALAIIESETTRSEVLRLFEQRIEGGITLKQVFSDPIFHPQFKTPIRSVRTLGNSLETSVEITHTNRLGAKLRKRYVYDGYAYLEIRIENGKLVDNPRVVCLRDALLEKGARPPQGVMRFWKGDTVRDNRDGKMFLIRQIKTGGGGSLIGTLITESREVRQLSAAGGLRIFSGRGLARLSIV
jgi:CRISPR-associated endonuclease Csn1